MKKFLVISVPVILVALILYGFMSWMLSSRVVSPTSSYEKTIGTINEQWGKPYEEWLALLPEGEPFEVTTFDDLKLIGQYFQMSDSSTCAIVMAHGWGSTWLGMLKYVPAFRDCNCDFVFYDHRVHGESEGTYATGGLYESRDLLTVTDWVGDQKGFADHQIGWVGSSWGASTAINAGASPRSMAFIVADAPFQDWYAAVFERGIREYGPGVSLLSSGVITAVNFRTGVDFYQASSLDMIGGVEDPLLLLHSRADSATASWQSVNLSERMNPARGRFHHLDWGNDHVKDVLNNTDEWTKMVRDFLREFAPHVLMADKR